MSRAAAVLVVALGAACGARSDLPTGRAVPPPRTDFCAFAEYRAGPRDVSLYILLDRSDSMLGPSWNAATTALSAFVHDPAVADVGVALQYFPRGKDDCSVEAYAVPAVPMATGAQNASALEASLAAQKPDGETPTEPALRGALAYARALDLADPSRGVAITLVSDGSPNACQSTTDHVAKLAEDAAHGDPQILTFVVGFGDGYYFDDLDTIAVAGGTGHAIGIGDDEASAQRLVDALEAARAAAKDCRYAVPTTGAAADGLPSDVTVAWRATPDGDDVELDAVDGLAQCGPEGGFTLLDPFPSFVRLCPASCDAVHASGKSRVRVAFGCGGTSGATTPTPGGSCPDPPDFQCTPACGAPSVGLPECVGGVYRCPPGTVSNLDCATCPAVTHGCCLPDGTFSVAQCVAGAWTCPLGASLFGKDACKPPGACAPSLPCPLGQLCASPTFGCFDDAHLGSCVTPPASCPDEGPPVCGCDGAFYESACAAAQAGVDPSALIDCPLPPGTFGCGPLICRIDDQICRRTKDLATGAPDAWDCLAAPPQCSTGCDCSLCEPCPPNETCKESCTTTGDLGRLLTCTQL